MRTVAALLLVAASMLGVMVTPAAAATRLDVTTPSVAKMGEPITIVAEISADQATNGYLSISFEGHQLYRELVEIPGGATKEVVATVGSVFWGQLLVAFEPSSGKMVQKRVPVEEPRKATVALFPSVAPLLDGDSVASKGLGPRADAISFNPEYLRAGAEVLAPVNTVMVTADDVANLDDEQVLALTGWVGSGGTMLFEGSESDLPQLMAKGVGSGTDRLWLGGGTIHLQSEPFAATGLDELIVVEQDSRQMNEGQWIDPTALSNPMADDAGISVLDIVPIMLFLVVYTLLIGPGLWTGLRSARRLPLYWVAVPVAALVATGAIWAAGRLLQGGSSTSYAALVADDQVTGTTTAATMIVSRNGGYSGVDLGTGWKPTAIATGNGFGRDGTALSTNGPELSGSSYGVDLVPGSATVLTATSKTQPATTSWAVSVDSIDGNTVSGTVTNKTSYRLEAVTLLLGANVFDIGDVASGESGSFDLEFEPVNSEMGLEMGFRDPVRARLERLGDDAPVNAGIYQIWRAGVEFSPSTLVVLGWTDQVESPVETVSGAIVAEGRTGFLTSVEMTAVASPRALAKQPARSRLLGTIWVGEGQMVDDGSRASVVLGPAGEGHPRLQGVTTEADLELVVPDQAEQGGEFDQGMDEGSEEVITTYSFELHPLAEPSGQLALQLSRTSSLDYWNGRQWMPSGLGSADAFPDNSLWAVPDLAIQDTALMVRLSTAMEAQGPILVAAETDDVLAWTVGAK